MKFPGLLLILIVFFSCSNNLNPTIDSPDQKTIVKLEFDDFSNPYFTIQYENEIIILPSEIGFQLKDAKDMGKNMELVSAKHTHNNETWKPVYGERNEITDGYKQTVFQLVEKEEPFRRMDLTFRVYNEGVAFKYTLLPSDEIKSLTILAENTTFNFSQNYTCWASERAQSEISKKQINDLEQPAERPLLIKTQNNFIVLGEANLVDFARMKFIKGEKENSLTVELHGEAKVDLPYTTPWRTIMIGRSAGELLEKNFIYENLSASNKIENVSWIKPGKVIREVTLTTQGGMACVDFAAENGLQFVEFDAGWYGHEYEDASDATTITVDPKRSPGPLDLHKIIAYAKSKEIGIILYVNRRALEKQLDEILPLYKSWGIAGVKYGFVRVGSQEWTTWLHEAVKKAAENNLMVDIHDEYRPTGFSRTYPNLMTQEGIRGDEESPSNEHTLKTLFTRMLAGAGDNTNCYYAPRVQEKMGGNVSQLAKAVMLYSPWQFLYWYDRPMGSPGKKGGAGSSEGYILNHPELEFFKNMPTVWDDTKVLEGEVGKFATLVRQSGDDWFLGSLTGETNHSLTFKTDFLEPDKIYLAKIYSYNPESESSTKVEISEKEVNASSELQFKILDNSGLAVHFVQR